MWEVHDNYMKQLKQLYNKTSKRTQNRLQELFGTFNFTTENIYNIADNKIKKRINTYIEQWKEQGLLKNNNYFTVLANNIYKRTRVKNSEILELLIYSAYIEEQSKLEEQEKQIMYEDANYYYEHGQQEVNKKKKPSILTMALFLALLDQPNYSGFNWKQYIEATIQYNAQQIYRQVILNIQQQKDLKIDSSEFQLIINRQDNQKLNINNDKISGAADLQMIGLNNLAMVEGIKEVTEDNSKVKFIAVEDDKTTLMCGSLNNQEFYINQENVFDRYYGENQKELKLQRIRCNGLVLGLNLPPIQHHFHYCRSYIMYLPYYELEKKYGIFDSTLEKIVKNKYNVQKAKLKGLDKKALLDTLNNMNKVYREFPQIRNKLKEISVIEHPNGGLNITPDIEENKYIMEINKKFYGDINIVRKQYQKDVRNGFHPKNTTYEDLGNHELGHCITYEIIKNRYADKNLIIKDWNNDITTKEIVAKAFNNLGISDKMSQNLLRSNISKYAMTKYSETIGEAFADYYKNKNNASVLSKEIVKIMKGMI